ncbi:SET and MYND domain-containing protein 4 isoform X2 [Synchiropus splendidus]|uniref:SET and MYND domain-containing protein 4 isoform X2 n=1 Tax=Synchiropus splendidus TaxID=270530 RepID=UPI00237E8A74|nr:SET and MYND domain-containing protein 4 isoform X2 [Synchiropus splendidus]
MDLPCVPWQDYVARKWVGLDRDVKESFTSARDIDGAFRCAAALTAVRDVQELDDISAGFRADKDAGQAAASRERGNSSFQARDYTAAALHYSQVRSAAWVRSAKIMPVCFQGICLAPQGSPQLSLCFANRSAALHRLRRYQESLDDVDRAGRSGYPAHLSHKLEARRASCLQHLSGLTHGAASEPGEELRFGLSPRADVRFSTEKGRHLVATDGIAAGEVIVREKPHSCVLIPSATAGFGTEHRRCHLCLRETLCLVPCEGCSYSRYCSAACMEAAWQEHHRWECPLMAHLRALGVLSHLALRVALKSGPIRATGDAAETLHKDSDVSIFHLLHHLNSLSSSMRFLCAVTVAALCRKLYSTGRTPASWDAPTTEGAESGGSLGGAVLRHLLQLRCNAQAVVALQDTGVSHSLVQSSQEVRIATALFSTLSLLNHSCCPNTSLVFTAGQTTEGDAAGSKRGVTATVRAAAAVQPGQEILHCYGPHSSRMPTPQRRRLLQEQYFFLCRCEACSQQEQDTSPDRHLRWAQGGGANTSGLRCSAGRGSLECGDSREHLCVAPPCGRHSPGSGSSGTLQAIQVDLVKAVDLLEADRADEALALLDRASRQSELALEETHPTRGELADATARAFATKGEWTKAASHLERSAAVIGSQYGQASVEMGRQLFKLAQLHFNGGARRAALAVIPRAERLLSLHCGPQCHEVRELQAMERCLQEHITS